MTDYIKREEAMEIVKRTSGDYASAFAELRKLPAVDVAPVRHGKRIPFRSEFAGGIQYCSVCEIGFSDRTAYCPHCGAVMDGWRKEAAENE